MKTKKRFNKIEPLLLKYVVGLECYPKGKYKSKTNTVIRK